MQRGTIPPAVVARVVARRGRAHVYEELQPERTALVVVDMQNAFLLPGVAHALCRAAQDIVPNINRLAQALRAAHGTVAWIKTVFTEDSVQDWSSYYLLRGPAAVAERRVALSPGSAGHALWAGLAVEPADLIIEKRRFSAFIQGSSDLAGRLRARGIDTILVTGTVTDVCCESTARDAMMLDFRTIMVSDGNAAMTEEDHVAALSAFYLSFGDVLSTDQVIAGLRRAAPEAGIAAE